MSARLCLPSYVVPGTYLENISFVSGVSRIANMELLLFMYDADSRKLFLDELLAITDYADRYDFSVHMPDEIEASHEEIVESTADFANGFVIHPPRTDEKLPAFVALMDEWRERYGDDLFRLENTKLERFSKAEAALAASRCGPPRLCADVGHLLVEGVEPLPWLEARAKRIDELHVHGFDGARDHVGFGADAPWLASIDPFLRRFKGIIELEIFSWAELTPAIAALRERLGQES